MLNDKYAKSHFVIIGMTGILITFLSNAQLSLIYAQDKLPEKEDWGNLIVADDVGCDVNYLTNTHAAVADVAARNSQCILSAFLQNDLLFGNGVDTEMEGPGGTVRSISSWLQYGAIKEDDFEFPVSRSFYHFYDPTRDRGLTDDVPFDYESSLIWAYNDSDNIWDWKNARDYYYDALTSPSSITRQQMYSRTFRAMGQVVHLITDAAQPQHTRDDAHSPLEGAPYENYCGTYFGTSEDLDLNLGNLVNWNSNTNSYDVVEPLPVFDILPALDSDEDNIHMTPQFKALWDTEQYTGDAGFTGFSSTPGMAEFSNFYFVTDDTMFTGDSEVVLGNGIVISLPPISRSNMHYFRYPSVANLTATNIPGNLKRANLNRRGEDIYTNWFLNYSGYSLKVTDYCAVKVTGWDSSRGILDGKIGLAHINQSPNNWQAHAEVLLPKAIAYSSACYNYFFRGRIGLNLIWDDNLAAYVVNITNLSNETISNGTWELYEDDILGKRQPVVDVDFSNYTGSLINGDSFDVTFKPQRSGSVPCTLVFKGKIGDELSIAIAARTFIANH